jgi:hypothetical protein
MKINGTEFKIGADPEFFVTYKGKLTSAFGLIPGTKTEPWKVKKGAVQVDGMALEFNIDPANNYTAFEENMDAVFSQTMKMIPGYEILVEPVAKGASLILPSSVADFGLSYISSQPKEARELGCSPDFNAYTKKVNPSPSENTPFRTASGHIHVGWCADRDINNESHLEACRTLTKALDVYLGIPSLIWDEDDRRRMLYGAAGAFRPKSYGMEYRVLSNKWITNPLLRKTVYHNTIKAIEACFSDPEIGNTTFCGLTAKQIISKENPDWMAAAEWAMTYGGVPSPKDYR